MGRRADPLVAAVFTPWLAWWGTSAVLATAVAWPGRRSLPPAALRLDVVIPAHNEEAVIGPVIDSLHDQQGPASPGRILVIADHCSDATAAVARAHGAEVMERNEGQAGKPPSLREGLADLAARPDRGDAVMLLDADCLCDPTLLSALSAHLADGAEVVQAAYRVADDDRGAVRSSLRRAFALRNVVRAGGSARLGLPSLLFGSGIALRWESIDALSFADPRLGGTGDSRPVGDDVLMALELLGRGHHPRFCGDAGVSAPAPTDEGDLGAQRLRWEAGQALMWRRAAETLPELVRRRDVRGVVALVDWMTPPLAPTVGAFGAASAVTGLLVAGRVVGPRVLVAPAVAASALVVYLGVGVTVLEGPRAAVDLFRSAPRFLTWKASLYLRHRDARRTSGEHRDVSQS
jgi:hypothetical protein